MNGKECDRTIKRSVLGREIRIRMTDTGNGLNVLIEGGDKSHIGAVAVAAPDFSLQVITFPGHREDVVCRRWAEEIVKKYNGPVVVEAGIHYNQIKKSEIQELLTILEEELQTFLSLLEKE